MSLTKWSEYVVKLKIDSDNLKTEFEISIIVFVLPHHVILKKEALLIQKATATEAKRVILCQIVCRHLPSFCLHNFLL